MSKKQKKQILVAVIAVVVLVAAYFVFFNKTEEAKNVITLIATKNPHAEVLELVKDDMAAKGYDLQITVVTDYVVENPATSEGDVMGNYFQHIPYLAQYNDSVADDMKLVSVIETHFEPMALYAGTKTDLSAIADGDKIAVPNDPVNRNRALLLLQNAGLIKLPEGTTLESQCAPKDIVENTYNLEIVELNAELIPGAREDVAYAVINGNNATLVNLIPNKDGLYVEAADSEAAKAYVNIVVVRPENADAQWVKDLAEVMHSQEVYDLIVNAGFAPTFTVSAK
ncbi:MAG: methionine ABC transporter substrate-binding protein [Clostridia bacterium]|nr:methionine ABC transporter substrate-binding protein [Clostridia bacterium]